MKLKAIQRLRPNAEFVLRGDELEWLDETQAKPTQVEIDAEIAYLESPEYDKEIWRSTASLTRRKFMLGIKFYAHGEGTLEDAINALRESLPEPQKTVIGISLDESTHFDRADQDLINMATAIGMTADEIDDFYKWADNEEWRNG